METGSHVGHPGGTDERPATFFADAGQWHAWLEANHDSAPDIWMGLRKKHVANRGLTWEDAVPEALCFGWIDSQVRRIDADSVRQPRGETRWRRKIDLTCHSKAYLGSKWHVVHVFNPGPARSGPQRMKIRISCHNPRQQGIERHVVHVFKDHRRENTRTSLSRERRIGPD